MAYSTDKYDKRLISIINAMNLTWVAYLKEGKAPDEIVELIKKELSDA